MPVGPYTVRDTKAVRRRIGSDLAHITRSVRRDDSRLHALVLTGGFARGEGAFLDGAPQNDYDLVAIRRAGPARRTYAPLAKRLERELGLHIDLAPVTRARLGWVAPTIFWYETALRGRVLWGPADALRPIRVREASAIRPSEGVRLLANRAAGLLLEWDGTDRDRRIQAAKALLGAMDACLLAAGSFAPSHLERWAQAHARRIDLPATFAWMEWAVRYKTDPGRAPRRDALAARDAAAGALLCALPVALRHAGATRLEDLARDDGWAERIVYALRAGSIAGAPRAMAHPGAHVRAATLLALEDCVGGATPDDALPRRLRPLQGVGPGAQALARARAATLC